MYPVMRTIYSYNNSCKDDKCYKYSKESFLIFECHDSSENMLSVENTFTTNLHRIPSNILDS